MELLNNDELNIDNYSTSELLEIFDSDKNNILEYNDVIEINTHFDNIIESINECENKPNLVHFINEVKERLTSEFEDMLTDDESSCDTSNDNIEGFKSLQNAYLYINCVVQNLNILYIDQLVNFASNNGIHLNLTRLVDPDYLQINNLPISVLELAYQRLNAIPKERLIHTTNVENVTEAVYNMIKNNNKPKKETFEKFKKMIILRDKYRKISIQNYMPELAKEIF